MKTPCFCESTEGDNPQCSLHPQPQRSELEKNVAAAHARYTPEYPYQPPATDDEGRTITEIHEKIQSGMEVARQMPEYEQEGRELMATDDKQWTHKKLYDLLYDKDFSRRGNCNWQGAVDAINAALNAEREKTEAATDRYCRAVDAHADDILQLRSAQAAIARVLRMVRRGSRPDLLPRSRVHEVLNTVDLSALDKYVAEKTQPLVDLCEWAWSIIANAGGGDWERESKEWQDAAAKWRDEAYHPALAKARLPAQTREA